MHEKRDRHQVPTISNIGKTLPQRGSSPQSGAALRRKRLGDYLVEAGLLTKSQVDVALNDQQITEMKFGEILAARGWVKQQTVEFLMTKVVLPERKAVEQRERIRRVQEQAANREPTTHIQVATSMQSDPTIPPTEGRSDTSANRAASGQSSGRRDVPISKPLPPVKSNDGDVNWVG